MTEEPKGTFAEEMSKIDENSKNVSFEVIMNAPYDVRQIYRRASRD